MKKGFSIKYLVLLLTAFGLYWFFNQRIHREQEISFDRSLTPLIYTKHARCRMDCRHIDEMEVKDILQNGKINYQKSDPDSKPDPKFALEGITRDHQSVRIIFAPSKRGMVVITCIDLDDEWTCHCN